MPALLINNTERGSRALHRARGASRPVTPGILSTSEESGNACPRACRGQVYTVPANCAFAYRCLKVLNGRKVGHDWRHSDLTNSNAKCQRNSCQTLGGGGEIGFNCAPKLSHQRCLMMAALKAEQRRAPVMQSERDSAQSCGESWEAKEIFFKKGNKSHRSAVSHCYSTNPQGQNAIYVPFRCEWPRSAF